MIDDEAIGLLDPDGGGAMLLQYAGNCLPIDEAQHLEDMKLRQHRVQTSNLALIENIWEYGTARNVRAENGKVTGSVDNKEWALHSLCTSPNIIRQNK